MSRVKIPEEIVFLFFFLQFFRILSEKFFRLLAENLQEVFKTTFYVSRGTVCGLDFFLKFWIVSDFMQEPLAWFSIFYLRVQSKNSGRNSFFILLFTVFSDFERKKFQTSGQKKLREVFKTNFYVSRGTVFGLKFFWKFWIVLDFLQKPLAWFSKFCLRVQSKNCGRISFFCFSFQNFFEFLATYFQTFGQKTSRSCQTTLCVSRRTTFGLNFSSIVLSLYGFSAETFGIVLKLLSSCPE